MWLAEPLLSFLVPVPHLKNEAEFKKWIIYFFSFLACDIGTYVINVGLFWYKWPRWSYRQFWAARFKITGLDDMCPLVLLFWLYFYNINYYCFVLFSLKYLYPPWNHYRFPINPCFSTTLPLGWICSVQSVLLFAVKILSISQWPDWRLVFCVKRNPSLSSYKRLYFFYFIFLITYLCMFSHLLDCKLLH